MDRFLDTPLHVIGDAPGRQRHGAHAPRPAGPSGDGGPRHRKHRQSDLGGRHAAPPAPAGQGGWGMGYAVSKAAIQRVNGVLAVEHRGRGDPFLQPRSRRGRNRTHPGRHGRVRLRRLPLGAARTDRCRRGLAGHPPTKPRRSPAPTSRPRSWRSSGVSIRSGPGRGPEGARSPPTRWLRYPWTIFWKSQLTIFSGTTLQPGMAPVVGERPTDVLLPEQTLRLLEFGVRLTGAGHLAHRNGPSL